MLVLVLPGGTRTFLRPLVDGPANRGLDVLPALVEGQDLGVRPGAGIPERPLRDARILWVRLRRLRGLHEALHRYVRLRQILDDVIVHSPIVHENDGYA